MMTRSIFYRVRSPQGPWIRAANTLPFTIANLVPETVYEIDVGDGQIIERTTLGAATAPAQVSGLVAQAGAGIVHLTWSTPADGGSPITDYLIEVDIAGGGMQLIERLQSTVTSFHHTGLTANVQHVYRVSAINAFGTGAPSEIAAAVPTAPLTNLVQNGDFANGATGWSLGVGWSVSDGVAQRSAQSVVTHLSQSFAFEAGATYRITFEIMSLSGSSVRVGMNSGPFSANKTEAGPFQADLTAGTGKTSLLISANVGTAIQLRNVVMVKL
jgi:hypothetical protein